jgi:DNA-binding MarR family transcriptional regulator
MTQDQVDLILKQWSQERPDLDPAPMGVIGRISRASRYIDQYLQQNFARFGLNGGEFDVLATLRRNGAPYQLTPTTLFRSVMLSSGAMTNRLDHLEKAGYIERKPDPNDRRGTLVTLTDQGLELIDQAVAAHITHEQQLLASLTVDEQQLLAELLRKLLLSLGDDSSGSP